MVGWLRNLKLALVLAALLLPGLAAADLLHSNDFRLDPDVADTFGGSTGSTSYQLTDAGGEAAVGAGSSQSYRLTQGYTASLPQSISLSVLPSGTMAYYPLDTDTGDEAYDVSANVNNGALIGSPSWVTGEIGDALSFNGTSQYVTVPTSSTDSQTGSMTIEAWVNLSNYTNTNEILSKTIGSGSTNNTFELRTQASTGDLQFLGYDTALRTVTSTSAVPTGGWHQVAVTKTGSTATLYIDGAPVGSGSVGTTTTNSNDMKIGARDDLTSGFFMNGAIDEVRLYDRTLSAEEVAGDYSAGASGLEFAQTMPDLTPGTSVTYQTDAVVRTDASGYQLSLQEPTLLTSTVDHTTTLAAISPGTIG
ncbi:MAG TPA: LamG domain-containing protein, partial [Candidatus Saccharimonadia bacterium]|nr:LamG domain-containing protein [Candidatus Saccharimonadia bacterium]